CQHHRSIKVPGRFVIYQVKVGLKRRGAKKIDNQLHAGVSVSGAGLAERGAYCNTRRYKLRLCFGVDIDINIAPRRLQRKAMTVD
ncbi:MAG: hypothetical protein V3S16_15695, partial [Candidatus Desulfatibia sp.]|uniref:hypothetical protein n=1 Tax=Candidatus Desulfatibia sp. TaxID=3101189 RepID=UPI002F2D7CCC